MSSIILHERLHVFLLRLGTKHGCVLIPLLFDIVFDVLAGAVS